VVPPPFFSFSLRSATRGGQKKGPPPFFLFPSPGSRSEQKAPRSLPLPLFPLSYPAAFRRHANKTSDFSLAGSWRPLFSPPSIRGPSGRFLFLLPPPSFDGDGHSTFASFFFLASFGLGTSWCLMYCPLTLPSFLSFPSCVVLGIDYRPSCAGCSFSLPPLFFSAHHWATTNWSGGSALLFFSLEMIPPPPFFFSPRSSPAGLPKRTSPETNAAQSWPATPSLPLFPSS